jgi:hypothetical protein
MSVPAELVVLVPGEELDALLESWRWLVPANHSPILITVLGDIFTQTPEGTVSFLDTVCAKLVPIAASNAEFATCIADPARREELFRTGLADKCFRLGMRPGVGECLSFVLPPMAGGELTPANVQVASLVLHQAVMGQVAEQTRGHADGTPVVAFVSNE